MTERIKLWVQAAEISFHCRVSGLPLRDRMQGLDNQEMLGVEPLLLRIERSQLRWLGIWLGCLPVEVLRHVLLGRDPRADPGHTGGIISFSWPGNVLGSPRMS